MNKLASGFYVSVLIMMINCIITLSKWLWKSWALGREKTLKRANCWIKDRREDIGYKILSLCTLFDDISQWACENLDSYCKKIFWLVVIVIHETQSFRERLNNLFFFSIFLNLILFFLFYFFLINIKFIQLITYNTKETLVTYKYNINTTYNTSTTNTYQRYF